MKKILYFLLLFPIWLSAQINESDSLKIKADLSLTGFWQGGNVETLIFRAKSGVTYKPWKKWVVKTQNSYVYQEFGKEKADADFLSLNFLYFNPEKKIYPQLLGFLSTNYRREISSRSLLGGGESWKAPGPLTAPSCPRRRAQCRRARTGQSHPRAPSRARPSRPRG